MTPQTALLQYLAENKLWQASAAAAKLASETQDSRLRTELLRLIDVGLRGIHGAEDQRLKVLEIEWNLCMIMGRRAATVLAQK